jgi:F420-dependent oxidoreductase-like protein
VAIVRQALARQVPVTSSGQHYPLPYPGGTGLGKPLKPIVHPLRADLPIILGAEGCKNVALAAEIGDGWLPIFYAPEHDQAYREALGEGFARPGARRSAAEFEVIATATVVVNDDVEAAADFVRPFLALYIGGMGARDMNFHFEVFARMGYEAEARKIQDLYLDGRKDEAAAAVPTSLVDATALIGPKEKIRDDLERWHSSLVTTLLVGGGIDQMRLLAELVG